MSLLLTLTLSACGGWVVSPLPIMPGVTTPSRTPVIRTPTPVIIIPTTSQPQTAISSLTPTVMQSPTATLTTTPADTPMPTMTGVPELGVEIIGCNTSLDITYGMGEVTNAYAVIRNTGALDLKDVCATLSASDEARLHPDKTRCIPSLPAGYQVMLKLTVDTGFQVDTSIQVNVITSEGIAAAVKRESCREIGVFHLNPDTLGVVIPIPTPTLSP